jgi:ABC-type Co2+ transport system permease subunit
MKIDDIFGITYMVAFALVAFGSWLALRGLTPEQKHRRYPKVALAGIIVLGAFFVALPIVSGQLWHLLIIAPALAFIGYVNVSVVRVCTACGHVAQSENLVSPTRFCPKCGTPLVAKKAFDE